jgi:hypothetical protein
MFDGAAEIARATFNSLDSILGFTVFCCATTAVTPIHARKKHEIAILFINRLLKNLEVEGLFPPSTSSELFFSSTFFVLVVLAARFERGSDTSP